jgi:hypothetical protein
MKLGTDRVATSKHAVLPCALGLSAWRCTVGYNKTYRVDAPSRGVRIATAAVVVAILVVVLAWSFSLS